MAPSSLRSSAADFGAAEVGEGAGAEGVVGDAAGAPAGGVVGVAAGSSELHATASSIATDNTVISVTLSNHLFRNVYLHIFTFGYEYTIFVKMLT